MILAKRLFISVVLLLTFIAFTPLASAEEPQVIGEAAILMDARTGQILYQKNANKKMYPASTTKMLTALVALEHSKLDDVVTVSEKASLTEGSAVWLKKDEQMVMEDLLYALMLNSANDAAIAIAEHLAGSADEFSEMLNQRAAELGAKNTHFTNPNGLPDDDHYTTAYDLAAIARQALNNEQFMEIVGTKTKTITRQDPEDFRFLMNHNRLLWLYDDAIGIKTGYTTVAQQCIVAAARRDDRELIAVVLKTQGVNIWSDSINLFNYGFEKFKPLQLIKKGAEFGQTKVKHSNKEVPLIVADDVFYNFPIDHQPNIRPQVKLNQNLSAPVSKGDVLGQLLLYDGDKQLKSVMLKAGTDAERPLNTYWWFWLLIIGGGCLILLGLLVLVYHARVRSRGLVIKRRRR